MLKRKNVVKVLGIGSLCLFLLGCAKESFLVQEESSTVILEEEVILSQEPLPEKDDTKVVHICGAVNQPGVYYLKENQRLYEGIQKAGGFRKDANQDYLNQAMMLEDGMKIIVPTEEETLEASDETNFVQTEEVSKAKALEEGVIQKEYSLAEISTESRRKVDLNTADEALLCTLPGIGENRAKSIIAYREEHGLFQKTEDIMKVSGIKEAAYEKIKDYVMISR